MVCCICGNKAVNKPLRSADGEFRAVRRKLNAGRRNVRVFRNAETVFAGTVIMISGNKHAICAAHRCSNIKFLSESEPCGFIVANKIAAVGCDNVEICVEAQPVGRISQEIVCFAFNKLKFVSDSVGG